MSKKTTIFIPARMASTRFPGKPLAPIDGIPMVVYCARNAKKTGLDVFVCTDTKEVVSVCDLYGIPSILTPEFNTGTDRVAYAVDEVETDYVVNLQGDEPLINASSLSLLIKTLSSLDSESHEIVSGVSYVYSDEAFDPNVVKCALIKKDSSIQYFSRKPLLNIPGNSKNPPYLKQLGLYGMTKNTLKEFASLPQGDLEQSEKVELLRWIENGRRVLGCVIEQKTVSVDTPNDLVDALEIIYKE